MQKINRGISFFRTQLKIKGKSEHQGRGLYSMEFDCSVDELEKKVEQLIAKKADMFIVERTEISVIVKIKPELCVGEYYNTLCFNKTSKGWNLAVVM